MTTNESYLLDSLRELLEQSKAALRALELEYGDGCSEKLEAAIKDSERFFEPGEKWRLENQLLKRGRTVRC
jgi:hypothetical protein